MILSITIMIVVSALSICIFAFLHPNKTPVLSGQRWRVLGLGNILIVETLGPHASFGQAYGKYVNVRYRLEDGSCGHCSKDDIRYTGKLLPYQQPSSRERYIEKILETVRRKQESANWEPYSPPPGWHAGRSEGPVIDADIVDLSNESKASPLDKKLRLSKIEKYRFLD
jgi:hypothetical protein